MIRSVGTVWLQNSVTVEQNIHDKMNQKFIEEQTSEILVTLRRTSVDDYRNFSKFLAGIEA